jgi:hypothetical protein
LKGFYEFQNKIIKLRFFLRTIERNPLVREPLTTIHFILNLKKLTSLNCSEN